MRIAFVGISRKYTELPHGYCDHFNKYHLELPYYYAHFGGNDVTIVTPDFMNTHQTILPPGKLTCMKENDFVASSETYDIIIHWRKWIHGVSHKGMLNLINCQDQAFSIDWIEQVNGVKAAKKLDGILCFPKWHKTNTARELGWDKNDPALLDGVTLGVDTNVYKPSPRKNYYQMLWASDPGRGLSGAIRIAQRLHTFDKRFQLHICYPDYCKKPNHTDDPALIWRGNVANGPELWDLFAESGILPYTSEFMEPSSRAHRQAQAAGAMVLYPPNRGTPSELIENDRDGIVSDPIGWDRKILQMVSSGRSIMIGENARNLALSENWQVQAKRFNELMGKLLGARR